MTTDWVLRWQQGKTGWHKAEVNSKLITFINQLKLKQGDGIFVPLCGKSLDMLYLAEQGFQVVGVELSQLAIESFLNEHHLKYAKIEKDGFQVYYAKNITLYCGNYFLLESKHLRKISAVYDRAALIALPANLRIDYVQHLCDIMPQVCQVLLLTLNYLQSIVEGPPFAVDEKTVCLLYGKRFKCLQLLCINDIDNESKFQHAGAEFIEKAVYLLVKK
jgi:thiopurine S-methyltransferase